MTKSGKLKWIKWPIIALALGGAGIAAWQLWPKTETPAVSRFSESAVTRGDLEKSVEGSGSIQPSVDRTVNVSDDVTITKLLVGVGDTVSAGGALAEVDKETIREKIKTQEQQIAQKELDIKKANTSFSNYKITAPRGGRIRELYAKVGEDAGDTAKAYGALCVISTGGKMTATLDVIKEQTYGPTPTPTPKPASGTTADDDTASSYTYWWWYPDRQVTLVKGDVINVIVDGEVRSASVASLSATSITVDLPGDTLPVGAKVYLMDAWGYERIAEGELKLAEFVNITGSGKVKSIHVQDGEMISRGDLLFSLDETDAQLSLEGQKLSLEQLKEQLSDYETKLEEDHLTSPISGTVVELMTEEGNTIKSGASFIRIMDASTLDLTIAVDELDITEVKTGMTAKIAIDAFEDEEFIGIVKEIGIIGTTSNSVTTYDVVVTMQGEAKIKASMSATANIVIEESKDTLLVPVEALVKQNGSYFARIPYDETRAGQMSEAFANRRARQQSTDGETPSSPQGSPRVRTSGSPSASGMNAEFTLVPVKIGLVNDTYAEILEGLSEGDTVLVPRTSTTSGNQGMQGNNMMIIGGGAMGGGGGGAAPQGGGQGGGGTFQRPGG